MEVPRRPREAEHVKDYIDAATGVLSFADFHGQVTLRTDVIY